MSRLLTIPTSTPSSTTGTLRSRSPSTRRAISDVGLQGYHLDRSGHHRTHLLPVPSRPLVIPLRNASASVKIPITWLSASTMGNAATLCSVSRAIASRTAVFRTDPDRRPGHYFRSPHHCTSSLVGFRAWTTATGHIARCSRALPMEPSRSPATGPRPREPLSAGRHVHERSRRGSISHRARADFDLRVLFAPAG
jgi:hypothetical protein